MLDPGIQVGLELRQPISPLEGLVVTKERDDYVGLRPGQPIVRRTKILGTVPIGHLVTGRRQIAENQSVIGKTVMDQRLKITGVLHPIRNATTDDRYMIAGLELEQSLGADRQG